MAEDTNGGDEVSPPARTATLNRLLLGCGLALFGLQFLFLCGFAGFIYHRFNLGIDFADYGQATNQIAHGNLNPYLTILRWPYIGNDFELITWPLGLLLFVFRSLFFLSVIQVACLVLAGLVAWLWIAEMLDRRDLSPRVRRSILGGALILLLLDPTVYFSTALDFHFEAFATLFAILAARSLWRERTRTAALWSVVTLLCGNLGGLYVAGVGLSGLLGGPRSRRAGVCLLVAGVVWIGLIGSLHDSHGSLINDYAYLAGRVTLPAGFGAALLLLKGALTHPGRVLHAFTMKSRARLIGRYLAFGGLFGLLTPWGFGVPALILVTSTLQRTDLFLGEPFQQRAVVPFVLFGTASLVAAVWELASASTVLGRRGRGLRLRPAVVAAVAGVVLAVSIGAEGQRIPPSFEHNAAASFIPSGEADALRHILARTPAAAEVIVSLPISGRFAQHKYLYLYVNNPPTPIPIKATTVVLVLDDFHTLGAATAQNDAAAISFAVSHFGAKTIGAGPDVQAVEWHASPGATPIVLP